MKRHAILSLATLFVPAVVLAQAPPPPQHVSIHADCRCREAHPGDTVHYWLTVKGIEGAHSVYADLQMRPHHEPPFHASHLPAPDFHSLGGGGQAKPEPGSPDVFQFEFVVPKEIYSGFYRGVDVLVTTDLPDAPYGKPAKLDVTHHAEKQARHFCLAVISDFGHQPQEPVVTNFRPGMIVPK